MVDFDERAAGWDNDPAKVERARVVADAIRDALDLDGSQRLFEYGAGTGLVTQALDRAVGSATLADTSAGMRRVMQDKIDTGTISNARVSDLDLEAQPPPDGRYDVIVTVLTLHHVGDVDTVLGRFADLLDEGGRLAVVDLDREDGSFHGPDVDVHHGFERSELAAKLTAAGFTEPVFSTCHSMVRDGADYPMFLAVCDLADT